MAVVSANLSGRDLGSVVQEIESSMAGIPVPEGFAMAVGGQNEEMVRSFDSMKFALGLAVFLVYLVMASQFESLLHPLVIMFTIPLGLVGSALGLVLTGQSVSVVVLIGLIMLAGIVVNNAIVLVDYINHLRRNEGMAKVEAVLRACTGAAAAHPDDHLYNRPGFVAHGLGAWGRRRDSRPDGHNRNWRTAGFHHSDPGGHPRSLRDPGPQRLEGAGK